jgi:CubicO group peptidase (beta-lactamase class C family)
MRPLILFVALAAAGALPATLLAAPPASKAEVARLAEQLLARNYGATGPGAAVLVTRGDEVLFRGARGLADLKSGRALSADDSFRIGSVSKQFAAAALLKLVEAGKVSLADPLAKYLPEFPNGGHITVLELLNHTSGVKSYTSMPAFMEGPVDQDLSTTQLVAIFKDAKPDFAPGAGWAYDNSGYVLVGAVIEAASGMPWHEYERSALFEPLGLAHTGYGGDARFVARQVSGYTQADGKFVPAKVLSMSVPHAAGALVSTVDDLVKWNRALHEGRVLKTASYVQMITPVGKAIEAKYGFGIEHDALRGQDLLAHSGGIFGFASMLDYVQGPDVSVAVLQNMDGNDGHDAPEIIARKLAAAALGAPYPAPVAIAVDAAALKQVEGVYPVDATSARVVRLVDGGLTAQRTGGPRQKLLPIGKDDYLYADGLNRFTVERDAAGAVTGMRFFAEGEGPGAVFARATATLPADRQEVPLRQAEIDRVLGSYQSAGMKLKVFLDGRRLMTQLVGQPAFEIFAQSPSLFFLTVVDATLEFAGGKGPAPTVTLHQGGQNLEVTRAP